MFVKVFAEISIILKNPDEAVLLRRDLEWLFFYRNATEDGVFGGVSDKTTHHKGAPTIYIHNNTIFGGITVKE